MRTKFVGSVWTMVWVNVLFVIGASVGILITFFLLGVGGVPVLLWQAGWNVKYILSNIKITKSQNEKISSK